MPEGKGYKKVSKRVSAGDAAYSAHGKKSPKPGKGKLGETGPMYELKPTKGKQPMQGSKSIEQADAHTASMEPGRKVGKSGKGKDGRAASAESSQKLEVKGPNEGHSYSIHEHDMGKSHDGSHGSHMKSSKHNEGSHMKSSKHNEDKSRSNPGTRY